MVEVIFLLLSLMGVGMFLGILVSGVVALLGVLLLAAPFSLLSAGALILNVLNFVILFIVMFGGSVLGMLSFI